MKRAPQAHSGTSVMMLRPPDVKEWEPGTSKQPDAFRDTCAPPPSGETLMGRAGMLGGGLSTRGSSASVSFAIYMGYPGVGGCVA